MPLTLEELKKLHDKAYNHGFDTRLKAADDQLFAWITQWDDTYLNESDLLYRGEFNILRKATRRILSDLSINQVMVDFEPTSDTPEEAADLMDGMYRSDNRNNIGQEALKNGRQEAVVCGYGAWEWRNEYLNTRAGDERQVLRRYPIFEANNTVMWDPNAKLIDKSDAKYVSHLAPYSDDGYLDLVEELTGERPSEVDRSNFAFPEHSYVFPWIGEDAKIYVTRFYHKTTEKVKYLTFSNDFNQEETIGSEEFEDREDFYADNGFELVDEKVVERDVVTLYIASGEKILGTYEVPGGVIPVIPFYGERAFVEGEEHYEGITRLAKDPQRLRNFQLSYLADITSRSPREKPIFTQEQIGGFEDMYEASGAENNLPYLLQHSFTANGEPLPVGPVGYVKAPEVPNALTQSIAESRAAVDDVAGESLPADISDVDLSGKAINALNKRLDMQSYTYQDHSKYALRRDAEVYAAMTGAIKDIEEDVVLIKLDGSRATETINKEQFNFDTFELEIANALPEMHFDVYADIGPTFDSVKEQNREQIKELLGSLQAGTPMHTILLNEFLTLMDGSGFKDIRDYARKELIMMGVKEPETDEEIAMVQQAQMNQQPNAQDVALIQEGQARMMEGQAAVQNEINDANKNKIELFKAETDRLKVNIQAEEAGVKIQNTQADTTGKRIDNAMKLRTPVTNQS